MIQRCTRCKYRGAILRGECINCGYDTTLDRVLIAEMEAELGLMGKRHVPRKRKRREITCRGVKM